MYDDAPGLHRHDGGIGTLLSNAVADAQEVARAEIALQKARALAKVAEARAGVVLLLGAATCACMALTGIVVGALLVLAPLVGPLGATLIVVGVLLLIAGLLGWFALQHFKRMFGAAGGTT